MSYTKKQLALTVTLGAGQFGADKGDTVTLTNFRMTAEASQPGGESMGMCQLRVFGMLNETMNKLTTIGQINRAIRTKNSILLAAGDDTDGMQTVFQGTIFDAWADYNSAPDVAFNIIAYEGLDLAVKPVNATSFKGVADVGTIMQGFANDAGLILENNAVSVQLSNPYFAGTTLDKIRTCARAANVFYTIDRGVLAIWPKDGARAADIPTVSPQTGMVGYPSLSSKGMTVKTLFNFNIKLGADVNVQSSIPMACGKQRVSNVAHSLSCQVPGGPWFTTMDLYNVSGQ